MSSSCIRKTFKEMINRHLLGSTNLSPHSLRSGGASCVAENGSSDHLISKHGRWKSEGAWNGYIKGTLSNRLFIVKELGLARFSQVTSIFTSTTHEFSTTVSAWTTFHQFYVISVRIISLYSPGGLGLSVPVRSNGQELLFLPE